MLCKPRFNFDKFLEITYKLHSSKKRKRQECDDICNNNTQVISDTLIKEFDKLFTQQNKLTEYLV
jgi:hypothetical protein